MHVSQSHLAETLSSSLSHCFSFSVFIESGQASLYPGDQVFVVGRSQKRGYLIVEHGEFHLHIPHYFTELRVSPSH